MFGPVSYTHLDVYKRQAHSFGVVSTTTVKREGFSSVIEVLDLVFWNVESEIASITAFDYFSCVSTPCISYEVVFSNGDPGTFFFFGYEIMVTT